MANENPEFFLVFFLLGLTYTCLLVFTVIRMLSFKNFLPHWKHAKILYSFQLTAEFFRCVSMWVLCSFQGSLDISGINLSFLLLSLPESLILASFILLFWVMLTANYYTRLETETLDQETMSNRKNPLRKAGKITLGCLIGWVILEFLLYLAVYLFGISEYSIELQQCVFCLVTSVAVVVGLFWVQCKYSGLPFRSNEAMSHCRRIIGVTVIWTLGRITHGILYMFKKQDLVAESNEVNNILPTIILIIDLFFGEIFCYICVLDSNFTRIFTISYEENSFLPLIDKLQAPRPEDIGSSISSSDHLSDKPVIQFKNPEDIAVQELFSEGKRKFGSLYTGSFNGNPVIVRKLNFPRINKYIIEKINEEVEVYSKLENPHIVGPCAIAIDKTQIQIAMEYKPNGSLYLALHAKNVLFSKMHKIRIARELAFALRFMHSQEVVHGHLSSHNVLLDSEWRVIITDISFMNLKKYAGLVIGYSNKSAWSSPELLQASGDVVLRPSPSDDVYSFGMILWEILTGQEPFPDTSIKKLKQYVVEEKFRPGIPQNVSEDLSRLIKSCWNTDPDSRPTMSVLFDALCFFESKQVGF